MTDPLTTFDDVKTLLGLEKTQADYPPLTGIMQSVHDSFENFTGRILAEVDKYSVSMHIQGPTRGISLYALPVVSIESFTIDGEGVGSENYFLDSYGIRLKFVITEADVEVTYRGGFLEIPRDLIRAETLQSAYEYQTKEHIGASSVTTEGGTVQTPPLSIIREPKRLITPYIHLDKLL